MEENTKIEGSMIEGLKQLIISNKESMKEICESLKSKGENRLSRLVKLAKEPTLSKEMTLDTYLKQVKIWKQTNCEV